MEIDLFCISEKVLSQQIHVHHIPIANQWTDALTKPLSFNRLSVLVPMLQTQCSGFFLYFSTSLSLWGILVYKTTGIS